MSASPASPLPMLQDAAEFLLRQESFSGTVERLKRELEGSSEPFVWAAVPLDTFRVPLPESIRSCWIFHLKREVWSGCHYHPNSVQHMVALNGRGRSKVGGIESAMTSFGSRGRSLEETWFVIPEGVPHEFFPEGEDMTVVSFHTCGTDELVEIDCGSGARRLYEPA